MFDNFVEKNILVLKKYGVNIKTEDDQELYRYGLKIIYSYIVNLSITLLVAVLLNRLYESAIMIFIFAMFQIFGGGYHASTKLKCLLITVMGLIAGNIMISIILNYSLFMIVSAVVLSVIIIVLGPVTNENHPVNKKTFKRSACIERIIVLLNFFIMVLLLTLNKNIEAAVIVSIFYLYVVSLITAKIKR